MKNVNLTKGNIIKKMILFSLPMILGNFLQQIYNIADTIIVGKVLGEGALAAVGSIYTLMTFITSLIIGLTMGSGALFSEDYGRNDQESLKKNIIHSFIFIFIVTIVIYLIIYPCLDLILTLLNTPIEIYSLTKDYVIYVFIGIVFIFLYNFFSYLLKSQGDSIMPLIFLGVSCVLNIVLDLYFVISLNLGVKGAAIATTLAQGVSGLGLTIYSFIKLPILRLSKLDLKLEGTRMKKIISYDLICSLQQSVMNLGILMIQSLVNSFGTVIMASFASAVKIDSLAYMPAQEFSNAYSLFVSQNYGAKEDKRIKEGTKIAFIVSSSFCLLVSIFIFFMSDNLMGLFIDSAKLEIINEGSRYLRIEGTMYIGIGILFLWYGYYRGISKAGISLLLTIISLGTRVLLSYSLAPYTSLGVVWIYLSIPIGWFLADITGLIIYIFNKKKIIKEY